MRPYKWAEVTETSTKVSSLNLDQHMQFERPTLKGTSLLQTYPVSKAEAIKRKLEIKDIVLLHPTGLKFK